MATSATTLRRLLILAALASACGGGDLTLPNEGEPAVVERAHGDLQNGTVGEALGDSLVVEVQDRFENPVAGVTVTWVAEGGGSVDPAESVTGADGRAFTRRVLGALPSTYFTIASVEGLESPATFRSTALSARLVFTSTLPAIAVSGEPLSPQPELRLEDADGTPIAREGVVVTVADRVGRRLARRRHIRPQRCRGPGGVHRSGHSGLAGHAAPDLRGRGLRAGDVAADRAGRGGADVHRAGGRQRTDRRRRRAGADRSVGPGARRGRQPAERHPGHVHRDRRRRQRGRQHAGDRRERRGHGGRVAARSGRGRQRAVCRRVGAGSGGQSGGLHGDRDARRHQRGAEHRQRGRPRPSRRRAGRAPRRSP